MILRPDLPIDPTLGEIVETAFRHHAAVVVAPPGAGKTTRVPVALAAAGIGRGKIVLSQPRRLAARAAATRIAAENGWSLGVEAGYRVRLDRRESSETRILAVTEGMLLRMLQDDPLLEGVATVVLDEVHERHLELDLILAMLREVQREVRPELTIVVMSATLEAEPIAAFLGDCPVIRVTVEPHPIEVVHVEQPVADRIKAMAPMVSRALGDGPGDVLGFLPGAAEIRRVVAAIADGHPELEVLPLYGALPWDEQQRALAAGLRRRVIVATDIAETSLTLPGVRAVVDSGLTRSPRFDTGCGLNRLETVTISAASARQRMGRAGRLGPGRCYRLWTEHEDRGLRDREQPEILRLELAGLVLQLMAWGEDDPSRFRWFETPPKVGLADAARLLTALGAVTSGRLTALGRDMATMPLTPRLARAMLEARRFGAEDAVAKVVALLSEGRPGGDVDLLSRRVASGSVVDAEQRRLVALTGRRRSRVESVMSVGKPEAVARSLLVAFPDRVARRRSDDPDRAVMVGLRGIRLPRSGLLPESDVLLVPDVAAGRRGEQAEATARAIVGLELRWLPPEAMTERVEAEVVPSTGRVRGFLRRRFQDLVVDEKVVDPGAEVAAEALVRAAWDHPEEALAIDRPEVAALMARVRFVAHRRPTLGLPELGRETLRQLLPLVCMGRRSLAELRAQPVDRMLRGLLTPAQIASLDRLAPERLQVPSGSRIRLDYGSGHRPVLAVRIQELFGLASTPTVNDGADRVLLHLLAPNGRPQQITDDLAGFWRRTWPEIRRELAGRYPKHAWPEDPLSATPLRGTRRRK